MVKRLVAEMPVRMLDELKEEAAERSLTLGEYTRELLRNRELILPILDEEYENEPEAEEDEETEDEDDQTQSEEEDEEDEEEEPEDTNEEEEDLEE